MQRRRGALHVHSSISYDGHHSIAELVDFFRARGLDFLCLAEHSDGLGEVELQHLAEEAARCSTDNFLVVPGVEFSCRRRLHLIGFGVTLPLSVEDPESLAERIREVGGVSVVAHPLAYGTDYPTGLAARVDGVEIWNITKDGWLAPGGAVLELWGKWRRRNPRLRGFGALDLHDFSSPAGLEVEIEVPSVDAAGILHGLRQGPLLNRGRYLTISGEAPPAGLQRGGYLAASRGYRGLRRFRDGLVRQRGRVG